MEQYINKASVVEEMKRRINNLEQLGNRLFIKTDFPEQYRLIHGYESALSFLDTLEVKDMSMPALDNGNMPVERWKEACEAASCQANYRKSKGLTETCDDYFVDGVQWADEHPKKAKEVNLEKELDTWRHNHFHGRRDKDASGEYLERSSQLDIAKHFFELGIKAKGE